jgi:curved DNA-binding protein CbpA
MGTTFTEDPYRVLGISSTASDKDIKKAYRSLALKHHPDRCTDPVQKDEATKRFSTIAHAYEILTNHRLRKDYDDDNNNSDLHSSSHHRNNFNGNETYTPSPHELSKDVKKNNGSTNKPKKKKGFYDFQFSDPYEVWKRDFRDQFGFDYPGAEYDFVDHDTPVVAADTATLGKNRKELLMKNGVDTTDGTFTTQTDILNSRQPKKKSMFGGLFGNNRSNNNNKSKDNDRGHCNSSNDENDCNSQLVVHDGRKDTTTTSKTTGQTVSKELAIRNNETQVALSTGDNDDKTNSLALVVSKGRNNRPIKMEVETKKDGKVTTTITTITRPDGTTETVVMKTGLPKKKTSLPKLTNGENEKLLLTNNTNGSSKSETQLALTNVNNSTISTSKESKVPMLTLTNGEKGVAAMNIKPKKAYVNPLLKSTALVVKK